MKYLITGAAGFIGSHFTDLLSESIYKYSDIVMVDSLTYAANIDWLRSYLKNQDHPTLHIVDIADYKVLRQVFATEGPDTFADPPMNVPGNSTYYRYLVWTTYGITMRF